MILKVIILVIVYFFIETIINLKSLDLFNIVYIMSILYLTCKIIHNDEFFDNITFEGKKYINNIDDIDKNEIINEQNYDINLNEIINEINKEKIKIIYNLSNRPIVKENKKYNEIKDVVVGIINLMKTKYNNLYLRNVININQEKIDNQAKLSFNMIIDYNNEINLNIYVEMLFEMLFENQNVFNYNVISDLKNYLNKLEFN